MRNNRTAPLFAAIAALLALGSPRVVAQPEGVPLPGSVAPEVERLKSRVLAFENAVSTNDKERVYMMLAPGYRARFGFLEWTQTTFGQFWMDQPQPVATSVEVEVRYCMNTTRPDSSEAVMDCAVMCRVTYEDVDANTHQASTGVLWQYDNGDWYFVFPLPLLE